MAEQLSLGEVISDSLTVEAQIDRVAGNDWTVPMRAALEIALSGGHDYRVGETFATMYWMYCGDLRHEEGEQIHHQAMAYCDAHDIGTSSNCVQADHAGLFEKLGRWDECIESAEFDPRDIPWDRLAFRSTHEGLRDYLNGARHPIPV